MTSDQYYELITPYADACKVVLTKLEILNHNIYNKESWNPVHHVEHRIKSKKSIEGKLEKKELDKSVLNAKDNLMDIAGIRVITYFSDEIFDLVNALKNQADLIVIREKDYISAPKENGYRSYHVIFGVPIYCRDAYEYYPVEIQFRTMSMDFWASMEHRINYKKMRDDKAEITPELQKYAVALEYMESRLQELQPDVLRPVGMIRAIEVKEE